MRQWAKSHHPGWQKWLGFWETRQATSGQLANDPNGTLKTLMIYCLYQNGSFTTVTRGISPDAQTVLQEIFVQPETPLGA